MTLANPSRFGRVYRRVVLSVVAAIPTSTMPAADEPFRVAVTIEQGPDRGQNPGALFEISDAAGRVVAGAGFQGVWNTSVRGERQRLQFFLRPGTPTAAWKIQRLPPIESQGTGFYPFTIGGELYVFNYIGPDPAVHHWNAARNAWEAAKDVDSKTHFVAGKPLKRQGERLIYDGVTLVDAAQTQEHIGEHYYAQGKLFVRQFAGEGDARTNRVVVYPWNPEQHPAGPLLASADWTRRLVIPHEFFYTFGQWRNELLAITNVGTVLRFTDQGWQMLREPNLKVSYQVYCGINFYDKLLLGQFPSGVMFEYGGETVTLLNDWPPVMKGVANRSRELQTAAIYGGDLYVGVWPWAEVWRYDAQHRQWYFVERMFRHPELTDAVYHPYEAETKRVHNIGNIWGQRVTGLVPIDDSLFITTSSKGGQAWEPRFDFLTPDKRADYSAIYRATVPGNLAVTSQWKAGTTTFTFTIADGRLAIDQDGRVLGTLAIEDELWRDFEPAKIRWGQGVFGPCTAKIVSSESTVASAP